MHRETALLVAAMRITCIYPAIASEQVPHSPTAVHTSHSIQQCSGMGHAAQGG